MELIKTIVDRATWLRGEPGASFLKRAIDGKQCCLGFLAKDLGQTDEQILGKPTPNSLYCDHKTPAMDTVCRREGSDTAFSRAMYFNDHKDLNDWNREWAIQQALKPLGIDMVFTGSQRDDYGAPFSLGEAQ